MSISRVFGIIALVVAVLAGFVLGRNHTVARLEGDPDSAHSLSARVAQLDNALEQAAGELEMARTRGEVDRQALEMLRLEMATEKEQTAELEEGLRFYRSLMAPEENGGGITVRAPEVVATERPRHYAYRLVVQQEAAKHELVRGQLSVTLNGTMDGAEATYELPQLADALPEEGLALQFRYFQSIDGELTLPEGFLPEHFALVVKASKPRAQEYRQQYDWRVKERFTNVGK